MSSYRYVAQGYGFPNSKAVKHGAFHPAPPMAVTGLGDKQSNVPYNSLQRRYSWMGRVSRLLEVFKASSKTGLINMQDEVTPQAVSISRWGFLRVDVL